MENLRHDKDPSMIKIKGYLEKKEKNKVMSSWKKYWFVLEGRLLLYYKSPQEDKNKKLCHCRGSIEIGLAKDIRPVHQQQSGLNGTYIFEIVTHSNNIILLRSRDKNGHDQWLQSLLDALRQPKLLSKHPSAQLNHFRYSIDSLMSVSNCHYSTVSLSNQRQSCLALQRIQRPQSFLERNSKIYYGSYNNIQQFRQDRILNNNTCFRETLRAAISDSDTATESEQTPRTPDYLHDNPDYQQINVPADENRNTIIYESGSKICIPSPELDHRRISDKTDYYYEVADDKSKRLSEKTDIYYDLSTPDGDSIIDENSYSETNYSPELPPRKKLGSVEMDVKLHEGQHQEQSRNGDKKKKFNLNFLKTDEKKQSFSKADKKKKVKRKTSFFGRLFKSGNNKKENGIIQLDDEGYEIIGKKYDGDDSEDVYECVPEGEPIDMDQRTLLTNDEECHQSKKLCGAREIMPHNIITELNAKLTSHQKYDGNIDQDCDKCESLIIPEEKCPGLPPRNNTLPRRPVSPWHDIPTNNTPFPKPPSHSEFIISPHDTLRKNSNFTNPAYAQVNKPTPKIPLKPLTQTVQQLVQHFNSEASKNSSNETLLSEPEEQTESNNIADDNQRRSFDELGQLLNDLAKITTAPLVQPRDVNSLCLPTPNGVQTPNSDPLSEEELLAIYPIRRRRHSDPDYDVPRSHRMIPIPPLPPKTNQCNDYTFRPISDRNASPQSTLLRDSIEPAHLTWAWRGMTPDSLESGSDITNYYKSLKETNNNQSIIDGFYDSLEQTNASF